MGSAIGANAARAVGSGRSPPHPPALAASWAIPPLPPPAPPYHLTHTRAAMTLPVPDTEFYLRCIRKCRAVPENERSANVRALLESHELIEAAVEAVPPDDSSGASAPCDVVSVALARFLRAYVVMDGQVIYPIRFAQ